MVVRVHEHNPGPLVEAAFRRIQEERMAGLPMLNPALRVRAVDFQPWRGHWLGMLVTPWSMALMLVPGTAHIWQSIPDNRRLPIKFPAGEFNFLGGFEADLGEYHTCPLIAAMNQFQDQQTAVSTAEMSLAAILEPPPVSASPDPGQPSASRRRFLALGRR